MGFVTPLERALKEKKRCNDTIKIDDVLYCKKSGKIILPMFTKNEANEACDIHNCRTLKEALERKG